MFSFFSDMIKQPTSEVTMPDTINEHISLILSNNMDDIRDHLMLEDINKLNELECYACYALAENCMAIDEYILDYYA